MDNAVTLACQLETIESVQRTLQTAKQMAIPSEDTSGGTNAATASGRSCQELAAQVTSLMQRLDSLLKKEHDSKYSRRAIAGTVEGQDMCIEIVHSDALVTLTG